MLLSCCLIHSITVNIAKFLRKSFFIEHLWWLFLANVLQIRISPVKFSKFLRKFFSTEHLWWLLLKSNLLQIMSNFLFETCGFTNNPNFLLFKWRLKRKHSPAKCVIRATEIRPMEIRLHGGQMAKWPL